LATSLSAIQERGVRAARLVRLENFNRLSESDDKSSRLHFEKSESR